MSKAVLKKIDINYVEDFGVLSQFRVIPDKYPDMDIYLLWGGRDAGKTASTVPILLDKQLQDSYFKCVVIRNVFDTIRDSCFSKIRTYIDDIENAELLYKDTSAPLEMSCTANGNKFIARGCDKPDKLKSIDDPSHVWIEEADQIPESAYDIINTTLRANVQVQQFLTFNPEVNSEGKSWIYDRFFAPLVEAGIDIYRPCLRFDLTTEDEDGNEIVKKCLSIHTTCETNPYCPPSRRATLASYKDFDINKYNVWYLGRWGRREVSKPFIYQFKETHVGKCKYDPALPVYVSFDFNVDPITAIVCQHDGGANGGVSNRIRVIKEYRIANSDIHDLCERIRADYHGAVIYVTGDASGKNASALVRGKINYYTVIREILAIPVRNIKIPDANPKMAGESGNRVLCNRIFYKHPDLLIDESCKYLIDDIRYVEADASGAVDKKTQGAHLMDTLRYYFNTFHSAWLKIQ